MALVYSKRVICALCAAMLMATLFCAGACAAEPGAVANINGRLLKERDLIKALRTVLPPVFHSASEEKVAKYRGRAMEIMIEEELFYQAAIALGMKPDRKEIRQQKKDAIKRLGGKKQFKNALKQNGFTEKEYKEELGKRMLVPQFVKEQIDDKSVVSDEDARAHYEEYKSSFKRPEARAMHHILIKVDPSSTPEEAKEKEAKARDLLKKLIDGADFKTLAWEHSEDKYKYKSGDLGLVHQGMLEPDIEKAAWKLAPGELSGLVRTLHGFHIIRVDKIKPSEQLGYDDVAERIKKKMTEKRLKELRESIVKELRSKAVIEVYEE
jgi:peptidyl-prolyl cis-trans isomerase C